MDEATEVLRQVNQIMDERREASLSLVKQSYETMKAAQAAYERAVMLAHGYKATNTSIARTIGVSETTIRLYIKRREAKE